MVQPQINIDMAIKQKQKCHNINIKNTTSLIERKRNLVSLGRYQEGCHGDVQNVKMLKLELDWYKHPPPILCPPIILHVSFQDKFLGSLHCWRRL